MQDKYRKLYNQNLLGTTDVSILKFYYASFKIQSQKGRVSNLKDFLADCAKVSDDTNRLLKLYSFLPLMNLCFGTGREQKRIAEIIRTKCDDVESLFLKDDITDKDIEKVLHGVSMKEENIISAEKHIEKAKEKILKCYSIRGRKQLGDRIFGYLLLSETIQAYTPEERLNAWHNLFGKKLTPSDTKLHATPSLNRSSIDTKTLLKHLDSIREFFAEINLDKAVVIIKKDMDNISAQS